MKKEYGKRMSTLPRRYRLSARLLPILLWSLAAWLVIEGGLSWPGTNASTPAAADSNGHATLDIPIESRHAISPSSASPAPPSPRFRIVCWNINGGRELKSVDEALRREAADFLILQEVDRNANRTGRVDIAEQFSQEFQMNAVYGIEFEELSQERASAQEAGACAYTGQATLSRLPLRRSRIMRFARQSGFWQPRSWLPSSVGLFQRRLGGRMALVTEYEVNGRLLVIYNVHLESRNYGRIQMDQLNETIADMKQYPAGTAFVLAGDFNSKYFPHLFRDKLAADGFTSATGHDVPRTHIVAGALDWIWIRGPIRVSEGKVRHDIGGSDHLPIEAVIQWQ